MYIMASMKVAEARARFGEMLDAAEKGLPVVIERRGVTFRLIAESGRRARTTGAAAFEFVDPAVMSGQWTWSQAAKPGLKFTARKRR
jgi:prevent-host-death family protein